MRLLKALPSGDFELTSFDDDSPPPYAILSHTWSKEEITYGELLSGADKRKLGYAKLSFCAGRAAADNLEYFWIDTCCINKSISDELSTAINSMFRYYQRASKCYVYLTDVHVPTEVVDAEDVPISWLEPFRRSRWFTRGWTLQELLAPTSVEFFSSDRKYLGNRLSLEPYIYKITQIPVEALRGQDLLDFSVEERMSWTAKRATTLKEDKVYCLLGIFGVFLPLIYGEGEENAADRLREEIQKRQRRRGAMEMQDLSDIPRASPKPASNVPFRQDDDYVDRGDILKRIDERCSRPAGRAALVGFGGFGCAPASLHWASANLRRKSQLAIEYAHRVRKRSPGTWIFWVHASSSARLEAAYKDIAASVGLHSQARTTANVVPLVQNWLRNDAHGRWLMIVDNADDEVAVELEAGKQSISLASLLPQSSHGAILVTSRNSDIARSLVNRQQDIIEVGAMSDDEAVALLQKKLAQGPQDGAAQLVKALDCIPLAIIQAAAYIIRIGPRTSVAKYLAELETNGKQVQLLHHAATDMRRDDEAQLNSVLATWQISFKHIQDKRPSAADLLSFMSFCNRQGIPEFLIRHYAGSESKKEPLSGETSLHGNYDFEEDVAVLREFSLVKAMRCDDEFEMHGLVQFATRIWLRSANVEELWWTRFVTAMAKTFPDGKFETWPVCRRLFPHIQSIVVRDPDGEEQTRPWAEVLSNAGYYACEQGLLPDAEDMVSRSLWAAQKVGVERDHQVLHITQSLAYVLGIRGKYDEAEGMARSALNGYEKLFGLEDPRTLRSVYRLAIMLRCQGRYDEAASMAKRAIEGNERVLTREHKDTILSLGLLGSIFWYQREFEAAGAIFKQVIDVQTKVLGGEHLDTLNSMSNFALVLRDQGKYEEAEAINRQVLVWSTRVLGAEHPDTLTSMNNFAIVLRDQGKYDEAEAMHRQVLTRREKILGAEHPDSLNNKDNLALVLSDQGKYEEAEAISKQVLESSEKVLGAGHPNTLRSLWSLAHLLAIQRRYDEADPLYTRACTRFQKVLGDNHPDTRACLKEHSKMLKSREKYHAERVPGETVRPAQETHRKSRMSRGLAMIGIRRLERGV